MAVKTPSFEYMRDRGFTFEGARAWIMPENRARLAQDAALITTPNTGVPVEITAYIDPRVIEILTAPRNARAILKEEKKGDWTAPYAKWRNEELIGAVSPYSDFANGVTSDVNENWSQRQQFVFQTSIYYGVRELAVSSAAKINIAAAKQRSAATAIEIAQNKYYLLGVENMDIYGILNDPNLPAAITPIEVNGVTAWEDKSTTQIYNDLLKLYAKLQEQSQGLIDTNTPLKLCLSPKMNPRLGVATDYNTSVLDMLNKYFDDLEIVTLAELSTASGEVVFMIAPEVAGQRSGVLAYSDKMRSGVVVSRESSYSQKFTATTYGGIVLMPFAFAQMIGIESVA